MGYGFDETTSNGDVKYFSVGINFPVELASIEFKPVSKDGSGQSLLMFNFLGESGETFRHIEWPVDTSRDGSEKKFDSMNKRIKHILTKFIPEEACKLSGSDYASFSKGVINLLGTANVGKKVAIKLLYNNKGYLSFTPYVGFIAEFAKDLKISDSDLKNFSLKRPSSDATPSSQEELDLPGADGITDDLAF